MTWLPRVLLLLAVVFVDPVASVFVKRGERCLPIEEYPQLYESQSFAPRLHVSYWDSHVIAASVLEILGTDLYGYNFSWVEDGNWGVSVFEGIRDDEWDINVEAWRSPSQLLDPQWRSVAGSYGTIGYPAVSGPFVVNNNQASEFSKRLGNYKSYLDPTGFGALPALTDPLIVAANQSKPQSWSADDYSYTPVTCQAASPPCGTYVVVGWAYPGTNAQIITNLNLKLSLAWASGVPALVQNYYAQGKPLLFYWWSPDRLIAQTKAERMMLPTFNRTQWNTADRSECCAADSVIASAWAEEALHKIARKDLTKKAPVLAALLRSVNFGIDQMESMMADVPSDSSSYTPDGYNAACNWVKENSNVWQPWLPPLYCAANYYSGNNSGCTKCPAGKDSLAGFGVEMCTDCSAGHFSWRDGEPCSMCSMGFYQPLPGQTACLSCPASAARLLENCDLDPSFCTPNDISHCVCAKGTYKQMNKTDANSTDFTCVDCPKTTLAYSISSSAECEGGSTRPFSKETFWAPANKSTKFFKCTGGLCLAGKPECFGDASVKPPIGARPGYPTCDEYHGTNITHKAHVLSDCEEGNMGIMCAVCEDGRFKYGKGCHECPDPALGYVLYTVAPLFWVFCFFPSIKYIIGQKITPSLFVTLPYIQLSAIIGSFGFAYPDSVRVTSSLFKVVNFDVNLAFFQCWVGDSHLFRWLFIQMIPLMYCARYFGQHYVTKMLKRDMPEEDALQSWHVAFQNVIFLLNMLYISLAVGVLSLYSCTEVEPDLYVMTSDNSVTCYEGDHAITLYLSVIPLVFYVIGWPLAIGAIFYTANAKLLLNDPTMIKLYGFLYKRYETQYFFWHSFIASYKAMFVIIKVFFFQKFMQGPLAMVLVFVFIMMQAYALPFESAILDRVMIWVQVTLFIQILIGILFCTEIGAGDMQSALIVMWFLFVFACLLGIIKHLISDVQRYKTQGFLNWAAEGQDCPMNVTWFCQATLNKWVRAARKSDWELMSQFAVAIQKYPVPEHLADPVLLLVKGAPELLDMVLFVPDDILTALEQIDINGNGKICKEEWKIAGGCPEVFDYIDVDGKGDVDIEVIEAALLAAEMGGSKERMKTPSMSLKLCEQVSKRYEDLALSERVEADRTPIGANSICAVLRFLSNSITQNRAKVNQKAEYQMIELTEAEAAEAAARRAEFLLSEAKSKCSSNEEAIAEAKAAAAAARAKAGDEAAKAVVFTEFPEDMVCNIFKEAQWGRVFWFLAHCSTEEKYMSIQCFVMLFTGIQCGKEKAISVLSKDGERTRLSDMLNNNASFKEDTAIPTPKEDPLQAKTLPPIMELEEDDIETVSSTTTESEEDEIETVSSTTTIALQEVNPLTQNLQEHNSLLGPYADLYVRYFNRYDLDRSGTIDSESDFEMLTINILTTGDFPSIPNAKMKEIINKGKDQLTANTNETTLETYITWFEASFIHKQNVLLHP